MIGLDENYNSNTGPKFGGLFIEVLQTIVIALGVSVVIYLFLAVPNQVDGQSMQPNIQDKEILLTNKFIQLFGGPTGILKDYNYQRGDIVVFEEPNRPDLVKRVIGLPGDRIKIQDGKVYINGELYIETFLPEGRTTNAGPFIPEGVEKLVPEDSYFLMGDNRSNSKDSRTIDVGFVKREYLKGSPFMRILPFDRFGFLQRGIFKIVPAKK